MRTKQCDAMLNKKETLLSSEQKGDYCQRLYLKKTKATFCLGHGFLSSLAKVPFSHQCCNAAHAIIKTQDWRARMERAGGLAFLMCLTGITLVGFAATANATRGSTTASASR
jgi:hypothetical protein